VEKLAENSDRRRAFLHQFECFFSPTAAPEHDNVVTFFFERQQERFSGTLSLNTVFASKVME